MLLLSVETVEVPESDEEETTSELEGACELSVAEVEVAWVLTSEARVTEANTSEDETDATEVDDETSEVEIEDETSLAATWTVEEATSTEDEESTFESKNILVIDSVPIKSTE